MKKTLKNRKGFTLVELMVVVAILGILVAVAVPVYSSVTTKAELKTVAANLRTINSAIMQYQVNNTTGTPTAGATGNLVPTYLQEWPTNAGSYTIATLGTSWEAEFTPTANLGSLTVAGAPYNLADVSAATAS